MLNKEIIQDREHKAWELRVRGLSQSAIAAELGVDQGTVSRILRRALLKSARRHDRLVDAYRALTTAQLERVLGEAFEAWQESKKPAKSARRRTRPGKAIELPDGKQIPGPPEIEEVTEVRHREGESEYLRLAIAAAVELAKLNGAALPVKKPIDPAESGSKSFAELVADAIGALDAIPPDEPPKP